MEQHQDMVYTTAARLLADDAQAEDIAQEVFLRAHAQFDTLRDSPTAGGWLRTVSRHLALNHLGRYRRRWRFFSELRAASSDTEDDGPEFETPETALAHLDAATRSSHVEAALAGLPAHQRVPLVLFHFEDLSYQDIATRLGVSLGKVKTDVHRGRLALAQRLADYGPSTI
jgi:RNA polymerase sigma-70 factor (ECF subfamily)